MSYIYKEDNFYVFMFAFTNTKPLLWKVSNEKVMHYKNTPIQIYRKFHLQKLKIFR